MADTLALISGRVLPATIERLDRVAAELGKRRPGEVVKRSDAMRVAIERGVEVLERELGLTAAPPAPKASKKGAVKPARKPKS